MENGIQPVINGWKRFTIEIVPGRGKLLPITEPTLDNPEILGHPDRIAFQRCIFGMSSSRLASLVRKVYVATRIASRWAEARSPLLGQIACSMGRYIRKFLFWAFTALLRRFLNHSISASSIPQLDGMVF